MITATITCRIFARTRLKSGATGNRAFAFARSHEPDGAAQVVRLWSDEPALMERLLWCEAGAEVTVSGRLTACLCIPVGGAEQKPLVDLRVEALEVASTLARWWPAA